MGSATTYLTQEEAEKLSDVPMQLTHQTEATSGPGCFYLGEMNGVRYHVGLYVQKIDKEQGIAHDESHRAVASKYGRTENVPGLGEFAYFSTVEQPYSQPGRNYQLYVRSGDVAFQIYADPSINPADARGRMVNQASIILSRLK